MSDSTVLIEVVEEVAELIRQGRNPEINDYIRRFPKLATELQRVLPLIGLVEQFGNAIADDSKYAEKSNLNLDLPLRLGDFELVRQIGQGGMGAVYEARQISLNRLVALKILTYKFGDRQRFRQRFEREARAAANLHHTNIVPVFGYGEESGFTYYTMQLIRGVSLDQLIEHLRTLTSWDDIGNASRSTQTQSANTIPADCDPQLQHNSEDAYEINTVPSHLLNRLTSDSERSRAIAELGVAAGQALHYAHSLGVIHRDIKPANMLIDQDARLWITDFGLAKATQDENLTEHNDLLGTLRYLSPERFRGIADSRSDLYSLALTLFELLTLRPAFDATDRSQLLQQTAKGNRPKIMQLNPHVPAPLAIIIEKSLAVDPNERYATVADFANDLQRFLEDKSISAKPDRLTKRLQRWCRHNPVVASLTAILLMTVLGLLVLQQIVSNQRDLYRRSLAESLISQARFQRLTGQVGQRLDGLKNLAQVADLQRFKEADNAPLVADAIRSMLLPDLELRARWPVDHRSNSVDSVAISPNFKHFVALENGTAELRTVPNNLEHRTELVQPLRIAEGQPAMVRFSPGGRWLIILQESQNGERLLNLFDITLRSSEPLAPVMVIDHVADLAADIDGLDRWMAVSIKRDEIWQLCCFDLNSQKINTSTKLAAKPFNVRYEREGSRVAITIPSAHRIQIIDTASGKVDWDENLGEDIYAIDWHPSEKRQLAIGLGFDVVILDLDQAKGYKYFLKGHTWMVHQLYFDPQGDYLVSHSLREGNSRVWDLRRRRQVLEADGHVRGFKLLDNDDKQLAIVDATKLSIYALRSDDVLQVVAANDGNSNNCWRTISHPTLPLLLSGASGGLNVWHAESGRLLSRHAGPNVYTLCLDETTGHVITAGPNGFHEWQTHWEPSKQKCVIGPPRTIEVFDEPNRDPVAAYGYYISARNGIRVASLSSDSTLGVWYDSSRGRIGQLNLLRNTPFASVSPDGRWIAACRFGQTGFFVWQSENEAPGRLVETKGITAQLFFSPNGEQLLICSNDRFTMFDVSSWQPIWEAETKQVVEGVAAFSPDSRTVALYFGRGDIRIVDSRSAEELLRLDCLQEGVNILNLHFLTDGNKLCLSCGPQGLRILHLDRVYEWMEEHKIQWPKSIGALTRRK